jgi:hypothetical protein
MAAQTQPFPLLRMALHPAPAPRFDPSPLSGAASNPLAFGLFLLLNAVLFIRPEEFLPELAEFRIYYVVICACTLVSLPQLILALSPSRLAQQPITFCVLGFLLAVPVSMLGRVTLEDSREATLEFLKVVLYYLLLLANVNTVARIRRFLAWITILIAIVTGLAVLQFHGYSIFPALKMCQETVTDPETKLEFYIYRLQATGVFNDPNDLCLAVGIGMAGCACQFVMMRGVQRILWLAPIPLFVYAIGLTQSRGGLQSVLVGGLVLFYERFGWKKTLLLCVPIVPAILALVGGRQGDVNLGGGTGQERIQIWSEGLFLLKDTPLRGIGFNLYQDQVGHVAHNSFVHAFVELGLFGGMIFASAFYLAAWSLWRLRSVAVSATTFEARKFRPFLLAIVCAYGAGMMSLSRNYVVPTFLVLGLSAAYTPAAVFPVPPVLMASTRLAIRLCIVSVLLLGFLYVFVRVFANFG